jgi:hypothetical protein
MSSDRRWLSEMVELCEEQGFVVVELIGGTGVRVMSKTAGQQPAILYAHSRSYNERLNREAQLKRLGVKLPSNHTPKKVQVEQTGVSMDFKSTVPTVVHGAPPANKFDAVRQKINAALDALADADKALTDLQAEHAKLQALKDLLKAAST